MAARPKGRPGPQERPSLVAEIARFTAILVALVSLTVPFIAVRTPRGLLVAATLLALALLAWRSDAALRRAHVGREARPREIGRVLVRDKGAWFAMITAASLGILALTVGGGSANGHAPFGPPSPSRPLAERLRSTLVTVDDLPDGWHAVRFPSGTRLLDEDEFCGAKPPGSADAEEDATFAGGPLDSRRIYSTAAHFPPGGSQAFLDKVRQLAGSCRSWPYWRSEGAVPVTATIERLDKEIPFGQEGVRVVVGGATPEVDFVYVRRGDVVGLVAYSVQDLPGIKGDEHTDPGFAEELAKDLDHRLRAL